MEPFSVKTDLEIHFQYNPYFGAIEEIFEEIEEIIVTTDKEGSAAAMMHPCCPQR